MEALRPIWWGQGLFLQPQHLQQQHCYHEARLQRYLQLLYPFCWGIKSLAINEGELHNYRFEVAHGELVTREGTLLRFRGDASPSNASIMPRSFETVLPTNDRPLGVYLGLKRLQPEANNLAEHDTLQENATTRREQGRFSLQEWSTADLFAPEGAGTTLKYLVHEVRVLFESEIAERQDYELIKVAELLRSGSGQGAVLSKRFIPPCLSIYASAVLIDMLKDVRGLLTAKGRDLSAFKRQHGLHTIELGSRETIYLLRAQMINRYIPLLHHSLEIEETHPCFLYALLRQLIGELSTLSDNVEVLGNSLEDPNNPLPPYRHEQLWDGFDAALRIVKSLLNEMVVGPDYVVPLIFDGEFFAADINKRFFEGNNRYYLSINADVSPQTLERFMTVEGKISAREDMENLLPQALFGLRIHYLEVPPSELPRRAHCYYFVIDHHDRTWTMIEHYQNIAVYCGEALPPEATEMQLLLVTEK